MTATSSHTHRGSAHAHDHGAHGHAHDHPHGPRPRTPAASLLRTSALGRIGGVAAALIALWAGVAWALA